MLHKFLRTIRANSQDPYFKQVSLLLHGDGTNGSQNNTFLDSSTNNFTITRAGNTTQGTNTPFSQNAEYWSNYFNATSTSFLSLANNAAYTLGTSDFTIEAYIYYQGSSSTIGIIISKQASPRAMQLRLTSSNALEFVFTKNSGTLVVFNTSSTTVPIHQWSHVAIVRNGLTLTLYINGVSSATNTLTAGDSIDSPSASVIIGAFTASSPLIYTNTYISNLRWVIGTAVYTANFTPSTIPLTAITNTCLLTCQSNNFKDNSSNNFAITSGGVASVQPFSPFAPTSAYSTSVNGGSGYFDGTNDRLTIADNANLRPGTSNFTLEAWIYRTVAGAAHTIFAKGASTPTGFAFLVTSTNVLRFTNTSSNIDSTVTIPASTWTHVAAVREGTGSNQFKLYINGVNSGTGTVSTDYNQTEEARIGENRGATDDFNGYISNLRLVIGTAVYTSNFTPPTDPLTAITNTQLLLNGTNAGIFDNAMKNNLQTVDNAQVSTSVTKFGTGSMSFDGTGDWLTLADTPNLQLSLGNFTIEGWFYLNAVGSARGFVSKGTSTTGWSLGVNALNQVVFSNTATSFASTGTLLISTWYHITIVREGTGTNQTKIYINGTNDGTGTVATNFNQTSIMYVGADRVGGSALNGYIDDLRITKGVARYTANFTPPSAPYLNS
jgi:hypothetical protein